MISLRSRVVAILCIVHGAILCHGGWIDPDTPEEYLTVSSNFAEDTREYELVFSDEFEQDGRTFEDGSDPRWTALDKNDYTNEALHFYKPDNVATTNGVLNITTVLHANKYKAFNEKTKRYYADTKHVQSGMVQGWNKFCMTGGIVEFSAKLPGDPKIGGLWPALWMLGNLARATYVGSSNFVWPYSYGGCDEHNRKSQKISACSKVGHYGMRPGVGRGSPEIDILEAMMGSPEKLPNTNITRPYFSSSLQIAPGLEGVRPVLGKLPKKGHWYEGLEYGSNNTQLNPFFYGVTLEHKPKAMTYQSDAISANTHVGKEYFTSMHKYRVEWEPPSQDSTGGYLKWYLDDKFLYGISGSNLKFTNTEIPSEPMYLIMNTAVASSWGFPKPCPEGCDCKCYECGNPECACGLPDGYCKNFPASFEIEYVRAYQAKDESRHLLGCSTENRPTAQFIQGHLKDYSNTEVGQKVPLLPVQRGGGLCGKDSDCGGPHSGQCSDRRCACSEDFTGPRCLSHAGFDDNPPPEEGLEFDLMLFSPTFASVAILAALAFIAFVGVVVFNRRRQADYEQLPSAEGRFDNAPQQGKRQQGDSGYASPYPDRSRTITYQMVDGRLLSKN